MTVSGVPEMATMGGGLALRARLVTPASNTPEIAATAVVSSQVLLMRSMLMVLSSRRGLHAAGLLQSGLVHALQHGRGRAVTAGAEGGDAVKLDRGRTAAVLLRAEIPAGYRDRRHLFDDEFRWCGHVLKARSCNGGIAENVAGCAPESRDLP